MMRVLVIDPDEARRARLCDHLAGCDVVATGTANGLREAVAAGLTAIVAEADLFQESNELAAISATVPVLLVAAAPSIRRAVASMRAGAADYLAHPLEPGALAAALRHSAGDAPAIGRLPEFAPMIGRCPAMCELFDRIKTVAATNSTVLIQGESGTGKEMAARALHAASKRRAAPMISLNCAVVPPSLIARELFGDQQTASVGARSGLVDAADGGTLFLDAIGDLALEAQGQLLTFLQQGGVGERRFDVRLVAATHHDLRQIAANGHFRDDLFRRLNAVVLHVPPLRDRGEDVSAIANDTLDRVAVKLNKRGLSFAADAAYAMRCYPWPGNVRELKNAVERAVILCQGTTIDAVQLAIDAGRGRPPAPISMGWETPNARQASEDPPANADSGALESFFLRFVLENQDQLTETELAERLGISRKSLWERRQRLNIPRRRTRQRGPRRDDV